MSKKSEISLTPRDIGLITPETEARHRGAVELLARQNILVGQWLNINDKLESLEPYLDKEIYLALETALLVINKKLKKTFVVSENEDGGKKRALRDLQTLAVREMERREADTDEEATEERDEDLFFSREDVENLKAARPAEESEGKGTKKWWRDRKARQAQDKKLTEFRAGHAGREARRQEAGTKVKETIGAEQLLALEKQTREIDAILQAIEKSRDTLERKDATDLQKANAKLCMVAVHEYATTPPKERSFESIAKAYAELQRVLDIKRLTAAATKRVERMVLGLEEQIAKARAKGQGIISLFEVLPKTGRLDRVELEHIYGEVQTASEKVETAYADVSATTKQVLEKLHTGSTNPAQVEGLVMTIENGNLNELYLGSFNVAMKEFNAAIEALSKLLNLRTAPELAARPEPKGLQEGKIEATETEPNQEYREMKELWGEKFLGCETVELAFTLKNDQKLIEFSPSQKAEAARMLAEFVNEPDVKQFMEKVKRGEIKKDGWQLRLEVATFTDPKSHLEAPLTMAALEQHLAPDMKARDQGKLLYEVGWYKAEKFYTTDNMQFQWVLSTDEAVPPTLRKNHETQTKELEKFAKSNGLKFDPVQSRSQPLETLYRSFVMFRANGRRVLENIWDWSAVKSSGGYLVFVGDCAARGARVNGYHSGGAYGVLGSSFSRRSGQSPVT